jgi:excinuclease ABC subunit C
MSEPDDREQLRARVGRFPTLPGVYLMRDREGVVIYVGKAKDLRSRVRSYFNGADERAQIQFLMSRVLTIDTVLTDSEQHALALERDLIAQHKPRYNIKLKDDRSYLSIRIDMRSEWPRLQVVRKIERDGALYFGPYTFSHELRTLLDTVKRVVPLRTCADTVLRNRTRPCLEYQIKRCAGPCCLPVDPEQYRLWLKQAIAILEGKADNVERELLGLMERAAEGLRFEEAAAIRDRLDVLRNTGKVQQLASPQAEDRDVFALHEADGHAVLSVLRVRLGRMAESNNFSFPDVAIPAAEVLEGAITQFYQGGRDIPDELVLPFEFENLPMVLEGLSANRDRKVRAVVPERGLKARIMSLAALNAQQHFIATFQAEARYQTVARAFAALIQLRQVPRRIECLDISNLQGSDIVGAIVTFADGSPDKGAYKRYKISFQEKPDDFAAVHEVVTRRLTRGKEEGNLPDLMIIDGGPGQLRKAHEARDALGVELEIISLAKMRTVRDAFATEVESTQERIYRSPDEEPIQLQTGAEVTRFVQRIRDEAHRFVITFHRDRRSKRVFRSALDDIAGVGPERRGRLLRGFGTVEAMKAVPVAEIAKIGRMPLPLAQKILDKLLKAGPEKP